MTKILTCVLAISSIAIFMSCRKYPLSGDLEKLYNQKDGDKSFLKDIRSDSLAEYYISGEFDGYKIYCASTFTDSYPSNDTGMNALYVDSTIGLNDMHLLRENRDTTVMIAIYFEQSDIFNRQFPYLLPHPNLAVGESAQMEFVNLKKVGIFQSGMKDDFTFLGHSNTNIKVQVTSFHDNIVEGTFEGSLTTKAQTTLIVKNGRYRLKIKIV